MKKVEQKYLDWGVVSEQLMSTSQSLSEFKKRQAAKRYWLNCLDQWYRYHPIRAKVTLPKVKGYWP